MTKNHFFDPKALKELAELLNETGLTEIELEENGRRVKVAKSTQQTVVQAAPMVASTAAESKASFSSAVPSGSPLKSPMVGTVYVASEPGAAPFVKVGDNVSAGQTVFIIEAMKVMNPVKAPKAGTVKEILVENGAPVEFDQVLLIIE